MTTLEESRPAATDSMGWRIYWEEAGQEWRTEPEIDSTRQDELRGLREITPDPKRGIFSFAGTTLSRADVEWLLAEHTPVDWADESQRGRKGLDLRGANLTGVDLRQLPLAQTDLSNSLLARADLFGAMLEGANLTNAQVSGANFAVASMESANLTRASLEKASFSLAHIAGSNLTEAHLEGANLTEAHLEGANLTGAFFDSATVLRAAHLSNAESGTASLADVHWGDVNVAVVEWGEVRLLGDETTALRRKADKNATNSNWLHWYGVAVRANRQLAITLAAQGLNEDANRFAYRALRLRRDIARYQGATLRYLFSLFLDVLAGYGYKPMRSFVTYIVTVLTFTAIYVIFSPANLHLAPNEALVISLYAFHGRGYVNSVFNDYDPLALVAAVEAFIGLLVEVIFIATLTQRVFGK